MTDTWAAKALEGLPRFDFDTVDGLSVHLAGGEWVRFDDALAAIARMGAGDDMVERLLENDREIFLPLLGEAAAHIAALTAQNRELALDVLASSGQAQEAYAAQLAAEAERDSLRERVARLEGERDDALTFLDNAVSKSPQPLKDLGAYLASLLDEDQWPQAERYLNAAVKSFAALTDGGKDE